MSIFWDGSIYSVRLHIIGVEKKGNRDEFFSIPLENCFFNEKC